MVKRNVRRGWQRAIKLDKLDMSKPDRVEWAFLENIFIWMGDTMNYYL